MIAAVNHPGYRIRQNKNLKKKNKTSEKRELAEQVTWLDYQPLFQGIQSHQGGFNSSESNLQSPTAVHISGIRYKQINDQLQ